MRNSGFVGRVPGLRYAGVFCDVFCVTVVVLLIIVKSMLIIVKSMLKSFRSIAMSSRLGVALAVCWLDAWSCA